MSLHRVIARAMVALVPAAGVLAGEADPRLMSLEELLDVPVTVASPRVEMTRRESPGVVTVITREEIRDSGATDLLEILSLLAPGFQFGTDVEGVVGIGVRGLWASEGKVLLLIDDLEANEGMFGTTQYGNHYTADNIERIEIIRGPGSAIYGGFAAAGVINVITREASSHFYSVGTLSEMSDSYALRGLSFGTGASGSAGTLSVTGNYSRGMRSDREYTDYGGFVTSLAGRSELDQQTLNVHARRGGLELRAQLDRYHQTELVLFGSNSELGPREENFDSYVMRLAYDYKPEARLTITPRVEYRIQKPWQLQVPELGYTNRKRVERWLAGVAAAWDPTQALNLSAGVEGWQNDVILPDDPGPYEELFQNGASRLTLRNRAAWVQALARTRLGVVTVGGRYDDYSEFGSEFVPRLSLTRTFGTFHVKAMVGQSFRVPGGILPNRIPPGEPRVTPEKATTWEVEAGLQASEGVFIVVNAFDIGFDNAIVFEANPDTGVGSYVNSGEFGTRGAEIEGRFVGHAARLTLNYAWYDKTENSVELYSVPGDNDEYLAFTTQRANALASIELGHGVSLHPVVAWYGSRHAFTHADASGGDVLEQIGSETLVNLMLRVRNPRGLPFDIELAGRNLLDEDIPFVQPYLGYVAPYASQSRSVMLRVVWER